MWKLFLGVCDILILLGLLHIQDPTLTTIVLLFRIPADAGRHTSTYTNAYTFTPNPHTPHPHRPQIHTNCAYTNIHFANSKSLITYYCIRTPHLVFLLGYIAAEASKNNDGNKFLGNEGTLTCCNVKSKSSAKYPKWIYHSSMCLKILGVFIAAIKPSLLF